MKVLYVTTLPNSLSERSYVVMLNNHDDDEQLTPRLARAAVQLAVGHARCAALVADATGAAYRLTPRSCRRQYIEY